MNLSTQRRIERAYRDFSEIFSKAKSEISTLSTTNSHFVPVQQKYKRQLEGIIDSISAQLNDVQKNAVWDKLVIAFIGVTNAGKSTIIESFRILFDEPERKEALKRCPSGVDGAIIGDGRADFTRVYKEYNMNIGGNPFVLIDVPGIEGNEGAVKSEILKALSKAHCVFYVQGEGKKPDSATVAKIKEYLMDWVKVYSIYNVKGSSFNYDEEDERSQFKTEDICRIEEQISNTMHQALGENYVGNITIQARLALCAKAKFALDQNELISEQKELLASFRSADELFAFSNFGKIIEKVDYLSSHFADEILEAQRKKLYKLHIEAFRSLDNENQSMMQEVDRIISKFQTCRNHVLEYLEASKGHIFIKLREGINGTFDVIEHNGCIYIDRGYGQDELTNCIKKDLKRQVQVVENGMKQVVQKEVIELRSNIEAEIRRLNESFIVTDISSNFSTNIDVDITDVVSELNFGFGDLMNWVKYFAGAFQSGWAVMAFIFGESNIWNPLGWIAMTISALFAIFGDSKEDKAKAKLREIIGQERNEVFNTKWPIITEGLENEFKSKTESFDRHMTSIIKDFETIKNQMITVVNNIKYNSIRYK